MYLPCRKPQLSRAGVLKTSIHNSRKDPHLSGVMKRSHLYNAKLATDMHLPPILVFATRCRCRMYLPCRDPHLSYDTTLRAWIYIACWDSHLSIFMTRSNLCYPMFAKDLYQIPTIAQNFSTLTGVRIGKVSKPGRRLRRKPRSSAWIAALRSRDQASLGETVRILDIQQTCSNNNL